MLHKLNKLGANMSNTDDQSTKDQLAKLWTEFKQIASQLEQIIWALNSNKEHLRYIALIHVLPVVYKRSEEEQVQLRQLVEKIVSDCHEVIDICETIRNNFEVQLRAIYADVNVPLQAHAVEEGDRVQLQIQQNHFTNTSLNFNKKPEMISQSREASQVESTQKISIEPSTTNTTTTSTLSSDALNTEDLEFEDSDDDSEEYEEESSDEEVDDYF